MKRPASYRFLKHSLSLPLHVAVLTMAADVEEEEVAAGAADTTEAVAAVTVVAAAAMVAAAADTTEAAAAAVEVVTGVAGLLRRHIIVEVDDHDTAPD